MANWWGSIREQTVKIKTLFGGLRSDILIALMFVLVGLASFALGRLSALEEKRPVVGVGRAETTSERPMRLGGQFVASKKGSKYHFPWCPGARSMKEGNKVWFDSVEDAQRAGYQPAGNCKGLK